ncbi:hypothetical protein [Streptomyces bluensis]|uniref:hypothetical protein n=1 Tax=Streptomyces bluensis TaxID=33897 RepID=UPI0016724030|nr:hypothetical protein [Streptomyces bluensis]
MSGNGHPGVAVTDAGRHVCAPENTVPKLVMRRARRHMTVRVASVCLVMETPRREGPTCGAAALVTKNSIAYRTRRENTDSGGFESDGVAHGPQAEALADPYADPLQRWAQNHRRRGAAMIRYLPGPAPSSLPQVAAQKRHGILAVTWH